VLPQGLALEPIGRSTEERRAWIRLTRGSASWRSRHRNDSSLLRASVKRLLVDFQKDCSRVWVPSSLKIYGPQVFSLAAAVLRPAAFLLLNRSWRVHTDALFIAMPRDLLERPVFLAKNSFASFDAPSFKLLDCHVSSRPRSALIANQLGKCGAFT